MPLSNRAVIGDELILFWINRLASGRPIVINRTVAFSRRPGFVEDLFKSVGPPGRTLLIEVPGRRPRAARSFD